MDFDNWLTLLAVAGFSFLILTLCRGVNSVFNNKRFIYEQE
jgi:hypothetical protein